MHNHLQQCIQTSKLHSHLCQIFPTINHSFILFISFSFIQQNLHAINQGLVRVPNKPQMRNQIYANTSKADLPQNPVQCLLAMSCERLHPSCSSQRCSISAFFESILTHVSTRSHSLISSQIWAIAAIFELLFSLAFNMFSHASTVSNPCVKL